MLSVAVPVVLVLPVPVPLLFLVLFRGLEKPEGHENTVAPSASRPEAGSSPALQRAARSPAHFRRDTGVPLSLRIASDA